MKKILKISILLLLPLIGFSQAGTIVNYEDELGSEVLTYRNLTNGKHSYNISDANGNDLRVVWTGSRWEIQYNISSILNFSDVLTASNPPDLATGNWQYGPEGEGGLLTALNGSGTTGTVLPVELILFSGEVVSKSIKLNWQTASELNNEKFEIEESREGRDYQEIGEVEGKGTTVENQNYSFQVENPRNGVSYYRLKQIDFDGQFEYSEVISINFKGKNGEVGEFYPNPSYSGIVNLDYTSQTNEEISVSVFDVTGKLVVNQILQISNRENNLSFDFSNLNKGIYIVKIGDEINSTHRKLLIEK